MFANLVLLLKVSAVTMQNTIHVVCRRAFATAVIVGNADADSVFPEIMDFIF